jgi:secreted PhoX family phosphatase
MKKNKTKKVLIGKPPIYVLEAKTFDARITKSVWIVERQSKNGRWVPEKLAELGKDYNTAAIRFGNPPRRVVAYHKLDFPKRED